MKHPPSKRAVAGSSPAGRAISAHFIVGTAAALLVAPSLVRYQSATGEFMFESALDFVTYVVGSAFGGVIYWAIREHGAVFSVMWSALTSQEHLRHFSFMP